VSTACLRQWDEKDAACLIQKAVKKHSLVKDYIGEEGDKERHGTLKTYDIESSKRREMQPTHLKESSVFDKVYQGDVLKLAVKDNAVDGDVPGAVATYNSNTYGPEDSNNNCVTFRASVSYVNSHLGSPSLNDASPIYSLINLPKPLMKGSLS
jgi:hypothetical protein